MSSSSTGRSTTNAGPSYYTATVRPYPSPTSHLQTHVSRGGIFIIPQPCQIPLPVYAPVYTECEVIPVPYYTSAILPACGIRNTVEYPAIPLSALDGVSCNNADALGEPHHQGADNFKSCRSFETSKYRAKKGTSSPINDQDGLTHRSISSQSTCIGGWGDTTLDHTGTHLDSTGMMDDSTGTTLDELLSIEILNSNVSLSTCAVGCKDSPPALMAPSDQSSTYKSAPT